MPSPVPPPPPPSPKKWKAQVRSRVEELLMEYDTDYIHIPWKWVKGETTSIEPSEKREIHLMNQIVLRSRPQALTQHEVDTKTVSLETREQPLEVDLTSEAGAAFGGWDGVAYVAAFHQTWELPIPSFWTSFNNDMIHFGLDIAISFKPTDWKPDPRNTDDWVWTFDFSEILTNAMPTYHSFRYVDGIYRCVARAVGQLIGGTHKIKIGFLFKANWVSGSSVTQWSSTLNLTSHLITNALYGILADSSEESRPLNSTLTHETLTSEGWCLDLLFLDADTLTHSNPQ